MFKKTLKQLKFLAIIIIVIICMPRSIFPRRATEVKKSDLIEYMKLNDAEKRLAEYKDDEKALELKLGQVDVINKSRRRSGAGEVKLDILSSRVGNKMCREAAENEYLSHWNLAGEKPYQRYAFAGGDDHVSENAFGEWTTGAYEISPGTIEGMMKKGHSTFMSEKAPNDGHKKTITDKNSNYVGIGYYLSEKQFRYYEEFIGRYFEFLQVPEKLALNEEGSIIFTSSHNYYPYFMIIFRDDFPKPLSPARLNKLGSYDDFSKEEYLKMPGWEFIKFRKGFTWSLPVKFSREGLYYIQIYAAKKELRSPTTISTKGKPIGSGIVIRVN
jgi:hypothetical protein